MTESNIKPFQRKGTKKLKISIVDVEQPKTQKLRGVQTQKKLVNTMNLSQEYQDDEYINFSKKFHKNRSSTFINNMISSDIEIKSKDMKHRLYGNSQYWYQKESDYNLPTNELDGFYIRFFSKCFVYLSKIEHLKIKLHKENIESTTYSLFRYFRHKQSSFISVKGLKNVLNSLNISLSTKSLQSLFWYLSKYRDPQATRTSRPSFPRKFSMANFHNTSSSPNYFLSYSEFRELFSSFKILIPQIYLESDWNSNELSNELYIPPVISSLMRQIILLNSRFIFDISKLIQQLKRFNIKQLFGHLFLNHISSRDISTPSISNLPSFKNNFINQISTPDMRQSLEMNKISSSEYYDDKIIYGKRNPRHRFGTVKSLTQSKSSNNLNYKDQNIVITDFLEKKKKFRNGSLDRNTQKNNLYLTVDRIREFLDHFNIRYLNEDLMLIMNLFGANKGVLMEEKFHQFIQSSVWNI
jgi:Ca2+-binding EF-hand superfamily protein